MRLLQGAEGQWRIVENEPRKQGSREADCFEPGAKVGGGGAKLSLAGSPGDEGPTGVLGAQGTLRVPGQQGTTGRERAHAPSPAEHWKNRKNSHEADRRDPCAQRTQARNKPVRPSGTARRALSSAVEKAQVGPALDGVCRGQRPWGCLT